MRDRLTLRESIHHALDAYAQDNPLPKTQSTRQKAKRLLGEIFHSHSGKQGRGRLANYQHWLANEAPQDDTNLLIEVYADLIERAQGSRLENSTKMRGRLLRNVYLFLGGDEKRNASLASVRVLLFAGLREKGGISDEEIEFVRATYLKQGKTYSYGGAPFGGAIEMKMSETEINRATIRDLVDEKLGVQEVLLERAKQRSQRNRSVLAI